MRSKLKKLVEEAVKQGVDREKLTSGLSERGFNDEQITDVINYYDIYWTIFNGKKYKVSKEVLIKELEKKVWKYYEYSKILQEIYGVDKKAKEKLKHIGSAAWDNKGLVFSVLVLVFFLSFIFINGMNLLNSANLGFNGLGFGNQQITGLVFGDAGSFSDMSVTSNKNNIRSVKVDGNSFSFFARCAEPFILSFEKEGFVPLHKSIDNCNENELDVSMTRMTEFKEVSIERKNDIVMDGMKASFEGSDLVVLGTNNKPAKAEVSLTSFDITNPSEAAAFPGDFVGETTNGSEVGLESFGFAKIVAQDEKGNNLDFKEGSPGMLVTFPIAQSQLAEAPETMPLWYFDEEKGTWIEEGVGNKVCEGSKCSYVGYITRVRSFHNLDRPIPSRLLGLLPPWYAKGPNPPNNCNKNSVCEPQLGETESNCADCKKEKVCNFNTKCESERGETKQNCRDCDPCNPANYPYDPANPPKRPNGEDSMGMDDLINFFKGIEGQYAKDNNGGTLYARLMVAAIFAAYYDNPSNSDVGVNTLHTTFIHESFFGDYLEDYSGLQAQLLSLFKQQNLDPMSPLAPEEMRFDARSDAPLKTVVFNGVKISMSHAMFTAISDNPSLMSFLDSYSPVGTGPNYQNVAGDRFGTIIAKYLRDYPSEPLSELFKNKILPELEQQMQDSNKFDSSELEKFDTTAENIKATQDFLRSLPNYPEDCFKDKSLPAFPTIPPYFGMVVSSSDSIEDSSYQFTLDSSYYLNLTNNQTRVFPVDSSKGKSFTLNNRQKIEYIYSENKLIKINLYDTQNKLLGSRIFEEKAGELLISDDKIGLFLKFNKLGNPVPIDGVDYSSLFETKVDVSSDKINPLNISSEDKLALVVESYGSLEEYSIQKNQIGKAWSMTVRGTGNADIFFAINDVLSKKLSIGNNAPGVIFSDFSLENCKYWKTGDKLGNCIIGYDRLLGLGLTEALSFVKNSSFSTSEKEVAMIKLARYYNNVSVCYSLASINPYSTITCFRIVDAPKKIEVVPNVEGVKKEKINDNGKSYVFRQLAEFYEDTEYCESIPIESAKKSCLKMLEINPFIEDEIVPEVVVKENKPEDIGDEANEDETEEITLPTDNPVAQPTTPTPNTPATPTTCTNFGYSAWSECTGKQTRTVTSSSPSGCTGGTPVLSQDCTPCIAMAPYFANLTAKIEEGYKSRPGYWGGISTEGFNADTNISDAVKQTYNSLTPNLNVKDYFISEQGVLISRAIKEEYDNDYSGSGCRPVGPDFTVVTMVFLSLEGTILYEWKDTVHQKYWFHDAVPWQSSYHDGCVIDAVDDISRPYSHLGELFIDVDGSIWVWNGRDTGMPKMLRQYNKDFLVVEEPMSSYLFC